MILLRNYDIKSVVTLVSNGESAKSQRYYVSTESVQYYRVQTLVDK